MFEVFVFLELNPGSLTWETRVLLRNPCTQPFGFYFVLEIAVTNSAGLASNS
jgi:hypothetical protein